MATCGFQTDVTWCGTFQLNCKNPRVPVPNGHVSIKPRLWTMTRMFLRNITNTTSYFASTKHSKYSLNHKISFFHLKPPTCFVRNWENHKTILTRREIMCVLAPNPILPARRWQWHPSGGVVVSQVVTNQGPACTFSFPTTYTVRCYRRSQCHPALLKKFGAKKKFTKKSNLIQMCVTSTPLWVYECHDLTKFFCNCHCMGVFGMALRGWLNMLLLIADLLQHVTSQLGRAGLFSLPSST